MGKKDPRVDVYIAKSADFAKPILTHLRHVVHEGCPDVEEGIKWGVPAYMHQSILCMTAAFKAHVRLVFWKGQLVVGKGGANQFGLITKVGDLPPNATLLRYVKTAAKLNESTADKRAVAKPAKRTPPVRTPAALVKGLARNKKAKATFDAFSPSHRTEYIEWIVGAKTDETRDRRIEQALEWMAEGKSRNWKYMRR
jgi:uncharacterized protein YdeI (YjbR/CyaY-like superfamily)